MADNPLDQAQVGELIPLVDITGDSLMDRQAGWTPKPDKSGIVVRRPGGQFVQRSWDGTESVIGTYQSDGWTVINSGLVLILRGAEAQTFKHVAWDGTMREWKYGQVKGFFSISDGIFLDIEGRLHFVKL